MDLFIAIAVVWLIGLIGIELWFRHSPFGWQDESGFHYGEEPYDKDNFE